MKAAPWARPPGSLKSLWQKTEAKKLGSAAPYSDISHAACAPPWSPRASHPSSNPSREPRRPSKGMRGGGGRTATSVEVRLNVYDLHAANEFVAAIGRL